MYTSRAVASAPSRSSAARNDPTCTWLSPRLPPHEHLVEGPVPVDRGGARLYRARRRWDARRALLQRTIRCRIIRLPVPRRGSGGELRGGFTRTQAPASCCVTDGWTPARRCTRTVALDDLLMNSSQSGSPKSSRSRSRPFQARSGSRNGDAQHLGLRPDMIESVDAVRQLVVPLIPMPSTASVFGRLVVGGH